MAKLRRSRSGGGNSPDRSIRSRSRVSRLTRFYRFAPFAGAVLGLALPGLAAGAGQERRLSVTPAALELRVGQTAGLEASVTGADGVEAGARVLFFSLDPADVSVSHTGVVSAHRAGEHTLVALLPAAATTPGFTRPDDPGIRVEIPVRVLPSELAALRFVDLPERVMAGASLPLRLLAEDGESAPRDVRPELTVAPRRGGGGRRLRAALRGDLPRPSVLRPPAPADLCRGRRGSVPRPRAGTATVRARLGGLSTEARIEVLPNPAHSLELAASFGGAPVGAPVRTGDVVRFSASVHDAEGGAVPDAPVRFALESHPDPSRFDTVGAGAPAQLLADGRFVAEQPGLYLVAAASGAARAERAVRVVPREVGMAIEFVGHAPVRDRGSSDLWVWEGMDGRDYAVLGTWNADGKALFFDVTDPADMRRIAEVQVDARTVNDVKVSADGAIAVITREGASNRRNGFVILDVADPRNPEILSRFDDELTGGVHNVFLHEGHIYAINNGRRWDVINAEDPKNPFRVSRFEDLRPGAERPRCLGRGRHRLPGREHGRPGGGGCGRRRRGRVAEEPGRDGAALPAHRLEPRGLAVPEPLGGPLLCGDRRRVPPGEPAHPRADHFLGGADALAGDGLPPLQRVRRSREPGGDRPLPGA